MNMKELVEKRNSLFEQSDEILNSIEKEDRSLESSETEKLNGIKQEILDINSTIEALESQNNENTKEKRDMTNPEQELKGTEQFLRKQGEERALSVTTTTEGEAIIPVNIADKIIDKMESYSNVFATAQRFNSVKGELRIPVDSSTDTAGFVGENEEINSIKLAFSYVKLTQRRVGAAITLTNHLINDAGFDIVNFAVNKLAKETGKVVELAALKGNDDVDQFEGILSTKNLAKYAADHKLELPAEVTYNDIIDIYNAINPVYLDSSQFIMSRALFSELTKLTDGNGHKYVQGAVVNGRLQQTLLGLPVVVSDQLTVEDGIIFGSVKEAYGIMVKSEFKLQYVSGDTQQATHGTQLLVFDGFMDGNVINHDALVISQPAAI